MKLIKHHPFVNKSACPGESAVRDAISDGGSLLIRGEGSHELKAGRSGTIFSRSEENIPEQAVQAASNGPKAIGFCPPRGLPLSAPSTTPNQPAPATALAFGAAPLGTDQPVFADASGACTVDAPRLRMREAPARRPFLDRTTRLAPPRSS